MGLDLDLIREHVKTCDRNAHPCGPLLYEVERLREALAAKRPAGPSIVEVERLRADSPTTKGGT